MYKIDKLFFSESFKQFAIRFSNGIPSHVRHFIFMFLRNKTLHVHIKDIQTIDLSFFGIPAHQLHTLGKIAIRDAFIAVNDDEHGRLTRFYELLCLCADAPGLRDSADTLYPLILGMFCQVRNICRRLEDTATPASHSEKIFYDFLDLLHTHYRKQRRVSFYAGELSLTPRHLTTVIRLVSGRSGARWIEEYIVLEAQILLRNSPMAIKEIAYELGFNEQSLFSKYFSRVSGSSPESYRRSSTA